MHFQEENVQVQQYLYKNDGGTGQPVHRILTAIRKVWGVWYGRTDKRFVEATMFLLFFTIYKRGL